MTLNASSGRECLCGARNSAEHSVTAHYLCAFSTSQEGWRYGGYSCKQTNEPPGYKIKNFFLNSASYSDFVLSSKIFIHDFMPSDFIPSEVMSLWDTYLSFNMCLCVCGNV